MKLCLALDLASKKENLQLLQQIKNIPDLWIKVGLRSFIRDGINLLDEIKTICTDFKIFLDLKLHDIPNTMADAAQECADLGIDMITIHTSSGRLAMQEVMQRLQNHPKAPLVFGVTALTSFDTQTFEEIYHTPIQSQAIQLAQIAHQSNLNGIVCSVHESLLIKQKTHQNFLTLTPGIRPFNETNDDQKRVATILQAHKNQSDFIVIGRPIYQAKDPLKIIQQILEEIQKCKS